MSSTEKVCPHCPTTSRERCEYHGRVPAPPTCAAEPGSLGSQLLRYAFESMPAHLRVEAEAARKAALEGMEAAAQAEQKADAADAGSKHDAGKEPVGLIPREAVLAEARVLAFGADKYAAHNWRKGMRWSRLGDAAMRHLLAWLDGEDNDPETGLPHLAHLRCCAGFLLSYAETGAGTDDRHKAGA